MVIKMHRNLRPAIAMIELIFALVIMGLTLLSAPLILNMSIQSANTAMQQESIAAAASKVSLILTYPWDEADTTDTTGYGILNVTNGDPKLNGVNRLIHNVPATPYIHRSFDTVPKRTAASTPNTFGINNPLDATNNDDIDDFHNQIRQVILYHAVNETSVLTNNEGEYLKGANFDMTSTVLYGNDNENYNNNAVTHNNPFAPLGVANGTSNIKIIRVNLVNAGATVAVAEHAQSVTLQAFACNIGDSSLSSGAGGEIIAVP